MDFHAFKRSKAVQSPVCLVGWNSRGTSVPVARGTQSSMAVTELTELCRSIDYRRVWTPSCPQLKPWPRQSRAKPHLLCSKGTTAFPAAQAARGAAAHPMGQEGEAPPAHAAAAVPACKAGKLLHFSISVSVPPGAFGQHGNDKEKSQLWQVHSLSVRAVVWLATSITHKHP